MLYFDGWGRDRRSAKIPAKKTKQREEICGMHVLLAEDEKSMADALAEFFRKEGWKIDVYGNGTEGLHALLTGLYDVAVLDVMLPGCTGYAMAQTARKEGITTPIMLLTAKTDLEDKLTGFDCGADDYVTKPFEVREVIARVKALAGRGSSPAGAGKLPEVMDLALDASKAMLICRTSGEQVRLSEKELRIMECFFANPHGIVSREQLALKVWGYENEAEYNNVEVYISFTRRKLAFLHSHTQIKAVRGLGYELRQDGKDADEK